MLLTGKGVVDIHGTRLVQHTGIKPAADDLVAIARSVLVVRLAGFAGTAHKEAMMTDIHNPEPIKALLRNNGRQQNYPPVVRIYHLQPISGRSESFFAYFYDAAGDDVYSSYSATGTFKNYWKVTLLFDHGTVTQAGRRLLQQGSVGGC